MKGMRIMLLGVGLILIGIFCRVLGIGYAYSNFLVHYIPIIAVLAGAAALGIGLFYENE